NPGVDPRCSPDRTVMANIYVARDEYALEQQGAGMDRNMIQNNAIFRDADSVMQRDGGVDVIGEVIALRFGLVVFALTQTVHLKKSHSNQHLMCFRRESLLDGIKRNQGQVAKARLTVLDADSVDGKPANHICSTHIRIHCPGNCSVSIKNE